jgi:hypothetical protein
MQRINANRAVIQVGDGRGFVIGTRHSPLVDRLVVTAAHCLPHFPPCHGVSYAEERTYPALLGPLGEEPTVWAECLFADPIADIAVLGSPDEEQLWKKAANYTALVDACEPLQVAEPAEEGTIWLLSLEGRWYRCSARYNSRGLEVVGRTEGGMSGSPIMDPEGRVVGVVCLGGGPMSAANPALTADLPGWVLRGLTRSAPDGLAPPAMPDEIVWREPGSTARA